MPLLAHLFSMFIAWCSWLFGFRHLKPNEIGNNKTVVIVGGGFGGLSLANYLYTSTKFNVILYDKKEYFEYTPSMLRVIARPSHMSRSHSRYADLPLFDQSDRRVRFVQDEVNQINDNTIRTKSGDVVKFHKLVLAMGSDYFGQNESSFFLVDANGSHPYSMLTLPPLRSFVPFFLLRSHQA